MPPPDETKVGLWPTPNLHARPPRLIIRDGEASFEGYQDFVLNADPLLVSARDELLVRKKDILARMFTPRFLAQRRVLDLGANGGFFSLWALQGGAREAIAVDLDEDYIRMLEEARSAFHLEGLRPVRGNVADWTEPGDVVIALALIHWIYSCTAVLGSLSEALAKLARLTRYLLIVEWIAPEDPAIRQFGHLDWNSARTREPYSFEAFEAALRAQSRRWEHLGDVTPTRKLYAAFMKAHEIDLSTPLPALHPEERIHASRRLATTAGVDYWSRVYLLDDRVHKQASFDLAEREAHFLSLLSGPSFPRVLAHRQEKDYSVVEMEKVEGRPLEEVRDELARDPEKTAPFVLGGLELLEELRRHGVRHRDIRPANVLVKDGQPVLLDFGWAVSEARPMFVPPGLGDDGRPPDGSFCDVYSMGKLFLWLLDGRDSRLADVGRLMVEGDPRLRLVDLDVLKTLVRSIMNGMTARPAEGTTLATLLDLLSKQREKLAWAESTVEKLGARIEGLETHNRELERLQASTIAARDCLADEGVKLAERLAAVEGERAELSETACHLADEAAAVKDSRVMRLARHVKGEPDLWGAMPDALQPLKDHAIEFGFRKHGYRLRDSPALHRTTSLAYSLEPRLTGLRGVLMSVVVDVPRCGGLLGVEIVSPAGETVARGDVRLDGVSAAVPTRINFACAVDVGGPGWQLRVFARDSRSPVRIHELRRGGWLDLDDRRRQPFCAFLT